MFGRDLHEAGVNCSLLQGVVSQIVAVPPAYA